MKTLLYENRDEPKYISVIRYYCYQRHWVLLNYVACDRECYIFASLTDIKSRNSNTVGEIKFHERFRHIFKMEAASHHRRKLLQQFPMYLLDTSK